MSNIYGKLPYILMSINREDIETSLDEDLKPLFDNISDDELWEIIDDIENTCVLDNLRGELYMDYCYEIASNVEDILEKQLENEEKSVEKEEKWVEKEI
mgnify:CR=1 FL=1|tara:strand:+ start:1236 stop:1532 length:297 start_codon:yes stop_codon:yes gene_type:complete